MAASPLLVNNFIDSCAFDPKDLPEQSAADRIYKLSEEGHLRIQIAHSTQKEIEHPNTPGWVKKRATSLVYTIQSSLTEQELVALRDIKAILAGNGSVDKISQDAQHVFEAQKYGGFFVTTDKRILDRARDLGRRCGITILRPSQFLEIVERERAEQGGNG